ncbi:hypothetical protein AGOR_G00184000 [Albula goreensis]|uniref:Uncharacterized protein n=1 Tax=Albula goreensis TaxID=1534307 RepID=A0A8T3CX87_9TELE|nr:hypothetical protein AGOR_G00184000 [Albula goreensis]
MFWNSATGGICAIAQQLSRTAQTFSTAGATPLSASQQFHQPADQMGCRCCRMIKSYIYDPSVPVDVHGRKRDSSSNSLYQRKSLETDNIHKVQGFHNLGYSHKYSESLKHGVAKLEMDNNQINRLHAPPGDRPQDHALKSGVGDNRTLYILHPGESPHKCISPSDHQPPDHEVLQNSSPCRPISKVEGCLITDAKMGGGEDTESVLSGRSEEVNTSTTSLSSADTKERAGPRNGGVLGASATESSSGSEKEEEEKDDDRRSVTDSEVAEALAALEAATAGEDYE